jgi:predicted PurR-regulated permease PerM
MNKLYHYILILIGLLLIGFAVWYFQSIVAYILISAVLSLIGAPIVMLLNKIRYKGFYIPKGISAGITLALFWLFFFAFFRFFVPLVTSEAQKLSQINTSQLLTSINNPINKIDSIINRLNINNGETFSLFKILNSKLESVLNIGFFTDIFSSLASTLGNIFIALFSISFITFFFLKDQNLFTYGVLLFVPTKHEEAANRVLSSTKHLLMRYFVGVGGQITGIMILVTIGLWIVGIDFNTCLVIALFAGIINVIPYIGPLIGSIFGIIIGLASKIDTLPSDKFLSLFIFIAIVFILVHLIDNILFQPLIFSSSVKAHPLEIFLVILIAGHIAGVTGMLVAVPGYTVVRVFAKQFLNNFKLVKKITEKI